jgi:hypothetical protein
MRAPRRTASDCWLEITALSPCHWPPLTEALNWGSVRKAELDLLQQVCGGSRDVACKDRETAKVLKTKVPFLVPNSDYSARKALADCFTSLSLKHCPQRWDKRTKLRLGAINVFDPKLTFMTKL